jgi:uncharacterized protein YqgC (DUF456 family)
MSFGWSDWGAFIIASLVIWLGVFCTLLPVVPGTLITFLGVLVHRLWLGGDKSVPWWFLLVGVGVVVLAFLADYVVTWFGAKYFGASWKCALGAVVGGILGAYFGPLGIILGSILLAMVFEYIEVRDKCRAIKAGVGTLVANILTLFGKLVLTATYAAAFYFVLPVYPWSVW